MNQMKEKSHSISLLASSSRGEIVLEETLKAERLLGFKVGKDFSLCASYYKNFHQERNEISESRVESRHRKKQMTLIK